MKLLWRFALIACVPVWAQTNTTINPLPSREFGQARLNSPIKSLAPNLVEGRELNAPSAIVFDTSVNPPILYVADELNSRVLAWRNPAGLTKGNPADKVIGQRDLFSTIVQGPGRNGSDLPGGLARPVGLAVDGSGNLYVMDASNNRILRYPAPFNQTSDVISADLVIGQVSTTSGVQPNQGSPVSGSTLNLNVVSFTNIFLGGIALDPQGNLWATDPGNHRVLRYPKALINQSPPPPNPSADLVIGQKDLFSNTSPDSDPTNTPKTASILRYPSSLNFDPSGGLYVTDSYARVLYYATPGTANSQPGTADRILGIQPDVVQGQTPLLDPNQYSLGGGDKNGQPSGAPQCIFTFQGKVFVCDPAAHRVVRYESPAQWTPATTTAVSPAIVTVVGQPNLTNGCDSARTKCTQPNRGLAEPDATTLSLPLGGTFDASGNLWICDSGNNRVLTYPASSIYAYSSATGVLGQVDSSASNADAFHHNAPNLVEGREVWIYNGSVGGGIVVDRTSNPPHLYVSDTYNNRILGFVDARVVGADIRSVLTTKADIVIGQPDLFRTTVNCTVTALNSPCTGDPQTPNATGLSSPGGIALDANGNLYVADSGNGRVLRFPAPFANASGIQTAERVLGQTTFGQPNLTTSQGTMRFPYGVVVFNDGNLGVSDNVDNRVLIFRKSGGGDFTNGQSAAAVVGQSSFSSATASSTSGLSGPLQITADDTDRLYICDFRNNRVAIYRSESSLTQGDTSVTTVSVNQPTGIVFLPAPDRTLWVAGGNLYHLLNFDALQPGQTNVTESIAPGSAAIAIGLDSFNNLIVGEIANRISFYFQQLVYRNSANATSGNLQQVAPGMMMYVTNSLANIKTDDTGTLDPPWPTTGVSGLQVLVNGVSAPIYRVSQSLIFIQVPVGTPTSGMAEFLITRPATGEIAAAGTFQMAPAAPGFFTANGQGTGQIAASNFADGSINGANHPAARGDIITLWLTGQGPGFQGATPPDGQGASGLLTDVKPVVFVNGTQLPDANVIGSAMTVYPGAWIINIQIPSGPGAPGCVTGPSCDISIWVRMRDFYSYFGGTSVIGVDRTLPPAALTTFRLKL
jgi:uncharacterized protein (TIGR03437 family)